MHYVKSWLLKEPPHRTVPFARDTSRYEVFSGSISAQARPVPTAIGYLDILWIVISKRQLLKSKATFRAWRQKFWRYAEKKKNTFCKNKLGFRFCHKTINDELEGNREA